jgi:protein phosphatase
MKIQYASLSHRGQVRPNNEDAFGEFVAGPDAGPEHEAAVFVVADGMGGHRGGEIASGMAVESVRAVFEGGLDPKDPGRSLVDAFAAANATILQKSVADASLFGMGTTCTAIALQGSNAHFAHIGDSRAYMFREGQVTQITQDHSLVGEMVRSGILTDEDARHHPKRNVITRSLGIQQNVDTDTPSTPLPLRDGDIFLLCSDGLTSYLGDDDIREQLLGETPEGACRRLVELANERGGRDNITVQVVMVESV